MATSNLSQQDLAKRRAQFAKYRVMRKKLEEERKRRRRQEFWRSIKLFFIISALLVTALAVFVLFNGAWTLIDPIINQT